MSPSTKGDATTMITDSTKSKIMGPSPAEEAMPPIMKFHRKKWHQQDIKGEHMIMIKDPTRKQGYLGNLATKTQVELEELIARQDKILDDVNFVSKLPDKGSRIRNRRSEIMQVLNKMKEGLEMEAKIKDIDPIEWNWRAPVKQEDKREEEDEEMESNPLHLMATHSIPTPSSRVGVKEEDSPADLIAKELMELEITDRKNIETSSNSESDKKNIQESNSNRDGDDVSRLSDKFCSSLLLKYEDRCAKSTHMNVFQPSKTLEYQGIEHQDLFSKPSSQSSSKNSESQSNSKNSELQSSSQNSESLKKSCFNNSATNHPEFGVKSRPVFIGPRQINLNHDHKSSLWTHESSATGPLRSFGGEARPMKVLSVRESLELERRAHDRQKKILLQEQAKSLSLPAKKIYKYRDVNQGKSLFNELGNFDANYLAGEVGISSHVREAQFPGSGVNSDSDSDSGDDEGRDSDEEFGGFI